MAIKYVKRNGRIIAIDEKTGKELKLGDRIKNKIKKGVINFSNKPFGLDYAANKGTDVYDKEKKRFLTQKEVDKKNKTNLPKAKKTSAAIRGEQKKNDKSTNVKKVEKKVVKDKPANKLKINAEKKVEKKVEKKDPLKDYRRGPGTKLGKDTRITKGLKKAGFTEDRLARLRKKNAEFKERRKKKKTLFRK
jgi:flagellar biosynthesis GTPase FlhF